jgi:hypothetical protein
MLGTLCYKSKTGMEWWKKLSFYCILNEHFFSACWSCQKGMRGMGDIYICIYGGVGAAGWAKPYTSCRQHMNVD